jgi:hypothetical protein
MAPEQEDGMANQEQHGTELSREMSEAFRELKDSGCPAPDLLQAAQADVLPPSLGDPVRRHLEGCSICQSLLRSLDDLDDAELPADGRERIWNQVQGSIGSGQSSSSPKRRLVLSWLGLHPWPAVAAAAAVVLLTIGVGLMRETRRPVVATTPASPVAPAQASPVLALEKAPIVLPAAALLVWRGQDQGADPWKELQSALTLYQSDDYAQAVERLRGLTAKQPRMAEAWFYLGVCRLFLKADQDAAGDFERARSLAQRPLADYASWYLAIAKERAGKVHEARTLLDELCRGGGAMAAKACTGLEKLPVIK